MLTTHGISFAATVAEVYADKIIAESDKTVLIPIKIKNNTGIMGFKISIGYDQSVLSSPSVTKGSLVENGMMNDSIGITNEGKFDVVWSGTENSVGDGTLMILSFMVVEDKNTQIKLSYSQSDTFNEAWEAVELKCLDIFVVFSKDELGQITEAVPESEVDNIKLSAETDSESNLSSENQPDSEEIKNAVDIVLGETGRGHIDGIPEEEIVDFVDRTNDILGQLTGGTNKPFDSVEEIKDAYGDAVAEEFVEDTKEAVDSDRIEASINNALDFVGAERIEQISEEKNEEFVLSVESNIAQYAPDVDTISDKLTADKAVEVIKQLQNENDESATQGIKLLEPQTKNNTVLIIAVAAAIIFVAAVIFTVIYKVHNKNKEEK